MRGIGSWTSRFFIYVYGLNKKCDPKPVTDNSRDVREMKKTCKTRTVCTNYFVFLGCFTRQISRVLHLELSRGRSGKYARDKGIFSCDKG